MRRVWILNRRIAYIKSWRQALRAYEGMAFFEDPQELQTFNSRRRGLEFLNEYSNTYRYKIGGSGYALEYYLTECTIDDAGQVLEEGTSDLSPKGNFHEFQAEIWGGRPPHMGGSKKDYAYWHFLAD